MLAKLTPVCYQLNVAYDTFESCLAGLTCDNQNQKN